MAPPRIQELSRAEGQALLDERAHHYLQISGKEFLCRWDAGEYTNVDRPNVLRVAMMIPFAR